MLQRVAVCCNVLQCVSTCCSVLQRVAVYCYELQCVVDYSFVQCVAQCALQCIASHVSHDMCNTLQHVATHCNMQCIASHVSHDMYCIRPMRRRLTHMSVSHSSDCSVSHKIRLEHIATHTVHNFVSITTLCQSRLCVNHVCV